jgi:hypothetical protein
MITADQERNLSDANARAKKKQDRTNPHVINIEDGRLMPNTPRLRIHPKYRVYTGPKDADVGTRMRWLEGATKTPKIVNTMAEADAFDVGTATLDEMQVFALENFGLVLDTKKPMKTLRKEIMDAAEKAAAPATPAEAELT